MVLYHFVLYIYQRAFCSQLFRKKRFGLAPVSVSAHSLHSPSGCARLHCVLEVTEEAPETKLR